MENPFTWKNLISRCVSASSGRSVKVVSRPMRFLIQYGWMTNTIGQRITSVNTATQLTKPDCDKLYIYRHVRIFLLQGNHDLVQWSAVAEWSIISYSRSDAEYTVPTFLLLCLPLWWTVIQIKLRHDEDYGNRHSCLQIHIDEVDVRNLKLMKEEELALPASTLCPQRQFVVEFLSVMNQE